MSDDARLIYFAPLEPGGLLDYAVEQLLELERLGQEITCVASKALARRLASMESSIRIVELPDKKTGNSKLERAWAMASHSCGSVSVLASEIAKSGIGRVLFAAFAEYFAPLWSNRLVRLKENGTRFGVVVHDPVRDFRLGPEWWHRRSIRAAYSFVDVAFVHELTTLETFGGASPKMVVVPHGIYEFPLPKCKKKRCDIRKQFNIPINAFVGLSFGHIRDGKNIDLMIRAIKEFPAVHLLVAGRPQSSGQKQPDFYRRLAKEEGVAERCHWFNDFIPNEDVWRYFEVSDFLVMLYSADFRSASGVLSAASQFEKPVLATGGDGPLKSQVIKYDLGVWGEPDSSDFVTAGLRKILDSTFNSKWSQFRSNNNWTLNSKLVIESLT